MTALESLDSDRHLVVDCGGGVIMTPAAVALLQSRGVVIWLDASWAIIRSRILEGDVSERPLVQDLGLPGLEDLFRRRRPRYAAAADFRLDSGALDAEQLAKTAMLRSLLWERRREGLTR